MILHDDLAPILRDLFSPQYLTIVLECLLNEAGIQVEMFHSFL